MTSIVEPNPTGERMFHEIRTEEQARAYLEEKVTAVETARWLADSALKAKLAQARFREVLIRYGAALGSLTTLMHCRVLSDEAYNEFHARIQGALVAKAVTISPP